MKHEKAYFTTLTVTEAQKLKNIMNDAGMGLPDKLYKRIYDITLKEVLYLEDEKKEI